MTMPYSSPEAAIISPEEIEHRFGFHKATIEGPQATLPHHRDIRLLYRAFAEELVTHFDGPSREVSCALTALQEASMWSHAAVAMTAPVVAE